MAWGVYEKVEKWTQALDLNWQGKAIAGGHGKEEA